MKNKLGAASLKMATLNGVLTLSRLSRLSWILLVVFSSAVQAFESAPYFPLNTMGGYWNYSASIHTGPYTSLPSIGLGSNSGRSGSKTVIRKLTLPLNFVSHNRGHELACLA